MGTQSAAYQDVYIKREDTMISLKNDVIDFCEKYIKPVHPENWDWSVRDFQNPKNDLSPAEARAIANARMDDIPVLKIIGD